MADIAELRPIGEVLGAVELIKLPEGAVPLAAIVLIKYLDGEGHEAWCRRQTDGVGLMERLGVLHAQVTLEEDDVRAAYRDIEPGDDFEDDA